MDIFGMVLNSMMIVIGIVMLIKGESWIYQKAEKNLKEYTDTRVKYMIKWQKIFCILIIVNGLLGFLEKYFTSFKTVYQFMTLPLGILLLVALFKSNFANQKIK